MFSVGRSCLLGLIVAVLVIAGWSFMGAQNSGQLPGGQIALVKLLWLALVIFFWYIMPMLLLLHGANGSVSKRVLVIHLINVWTRALIELYMVYWGHNWLPTYGISHDIFSVCLLLLMLRLYGPQIATVTKTFLLVLTSTFILETVFAMYMRNQVISADGPVYFVPMADAYQPILWLTWIAVLALIVYLILFFKRWLSHHA